MGGAVEKKCIYAIYHSGACYAREVSAYSACFEHQH